MNVTVVKVIILSVLLGLPLVNAIQLKDTPVVSGSEYILRVDGNKTELNWIFHFINKGNQTIYGLGISFIFQISTFYNDRTLDCGNSAISDSSGIINTYPVYRNKTEYSIPYAGQGGDLKPDMRFDVINTMECNGFIIEKEKWNKIDWIFTKVSNSEDLTVRYEIKKPLLKDIEIVETFPPPTIITTDANMVAVEWHTKENNFAPTLSYRYRWDSNSITLILISMFGGVLLDRLVSWKVKLRKRRKTPRAVKSIHQLVA